MVKEHVILHVGSLLELMEVGRSECQTQGIASFLRPAIARGEILVVAECTPEQLSLIERQDVALLRAFLQIPIHEPPQEKRLNILSQVARADGQRRQNYFLRRRLKRSNDCIAALRHTPPSPRGR
jgi:ATP-dependent Clp protease ATP-binding subunit ClpA